MPDHPDDLTNEEAAYLYRLEQARELFRAYGYIEGKDGAWYRPDDLPRTWSRA